MLKYYQEERKAFPKHHDCWVSPAQAAVIAETLLDKMGEPPATFILSRYVRLFDRAHKKSRTIEFFQPRVTLAAIIHELAHLWDDGHNTLHATAVCLFAAILKDPPK